MLQKKMLLYVSLFFMICVSISNANIQSTVSDTTIQTGDFILDWKNNPAQMTIVLLLFSN